ncbi:UBX domain-containing protein 6 [Trichonephila clavipes]|nr:UBX domain-containing protein 6 [Trichonephila clavipes]
MSAIRDFFKKKKAELKFQTAGPGHKLNESTNKPKNSGPPPITTQPSRHQPSEGAQRAGAAALARIEQKQTTNVNWSVQATKAQAKKEIELENASKLKQTTPVKKDLVVQESCPALTVSGVYFKCSIIGPEVLPKKEIKQRIKEFLYEQLEQERGLTACLIIHTINENKEKANLTCPTNGSTCVILNDQVLQERG